MTSVKRIGALAGIGLGALIAADGAQAQTKVNIGISGWTGFAPMLARGRDHPSGVKQENVIASPSPGDAALTELHMHLT